MYCVRVYLLYVVVFPGLELTRQPMTLRAARCGTCQRHPFDSGNPAKEPVQGGCWWAAGGLVDWWAGRLVGNVVTAASYLGKTTKLRQKTQEKLFKGKRSAVQGWGPVAGGGERCTYNTEGFWGEPAPAAGIVLVFSVGRFWHGHPGNKGFLDTRLGSRGEEQ